MSVGQPGTDRIGRVEDGWSNSVPVEHWVSSGVFVRDDRVLMCHRRADLLWYPDVWDFPGGHLEAGESAVTALERESAEELGIEIAGPYPELARWVTDDEDITFVLIRHWEGIPQNHAPEEHDDLQWFTLAEALDLKLPDPRYPDLLRRALLQT